MRLGVFAGDFSLDAVEAVAAGEPWAIDLLGTLLELVDGSLLRQRDIAGMPFFSMLAPVRELAARPLRRTRSDEAAVRRAHADVLRAVSPSEVEPLLRGSTQQAAVERLEAERDNVRAGYRHLMAIGEVDTVADAVWRLLLYWWIRNLLPTAKAWMDDLLADRAGRSTTRTRAMAITLSSWVSLSQPGTEVDTEPLEEAAELFRDAGDRFGEGGRDDRAGRRVRHVGRPRTSTAPRSCSGAHSSWSRANDDATFNAAVPRPAREHRAPARARPAMRCAMYDEVIEDAVRMGNRFVEMIELTNAGWARLALGEARPRVVRAPPRAHGAASATRTGSATRSRAWPPVRSRSATSSGRGCSSAPSTRLRTRTGQCRPADLPHSGPFVERVLASARGIRIRGGRASAAAR